jgi:hypothetical protein
VPEERRRQQDRPCDEYRRPGTSNHPLVAVGSGETGTSIADVSNEPI